MTALAFALWPLGRAHDVPVGLTSVIVQSQALFTIAFAAVLLGERPHLYHAVGYALVLAGAGLDSHAAMKALRGIAPQGSNAELLFSRGLPSAAPPGRPDDFTAPETP